MYEFNLDLIKLDFPAAFGPVLQKIQADAYLRNPFLKSIYDFNWMPVLIVFNFEEH